MKLVYTCCLLAALAAGCGEEFSNAPLAADGEFADAIPRRAYLRVGGPPESAEAALTEDAEAAPAAQATFYLITRQTTVGLDWIVFSHLRAVEAVTAQPPTERTDERRVWGPYPDALSPADTRFVITRNGDHFDYALEQRLKHVEGAEYEAVVSGWYEPGRGTIVFDLDRSAERARTGASGVVTVDWSRVDGRVDMVLQFADYVAGQGATPVDAAQASTRRADGSGELELSFRDENGVPVLVRTRWTPDGRGRADAEWRPRSGQSVVLSECWNARFERVFYDDTAHLEGEVGACPYAEVALPERLPEADGT